jgi:hypothetical protein
MVGLDVVLQRLGHGGVAGVAGFQHDDGGHQRAAAAVGHADHGAFGDGGVLQQHALHLGAGDVVAGGDDHVVVARPGTRNSPRRRG